MVTDTKDMKRAQRNHELNLATKNEIFSQEQLQRGKVPQICNNRNCIYKTIPEFSVLVLLGVINEH